MSRSKSTFKTFGLCLAAAFMVPASAQAQGGYYGNQASFQQQMPSQSPWANPIYGNRHDGSGDKFKKIARLALTAGGTVVAGLFGKQFGPVGMIAGGALGFVVSNWLGKKLLGDTYDSGRDNFFGFGSSNGNSWTNPSQGPHWGGPSIMPNPGQFGGPGQLPPYVGKGSSTYSGGGNLGDLREAFHNAMRDFTRTLSNGSDSEKESARTAYDNARSEYYRALSDK